MNVDIDDPIYEADGTSKLRRLKCYLRTVDNDTAIRTLKALWDYREMRRRGAEDRAPNAHGRFLQLLARIGGKTGEDDGAKPKPAFDTASFKYCTTRSSHYRHWTRSHGDTGLKSF